MRRLFVAVLLSATVFTFGAAPAAADRWTAIGDTAFQTLTEDSGIPNPIVTSIAEDGDGFLWIGTQAGVARWDGYRFRVFKPDVNDPHALHDNYVIALHTDTRGRLWIGTSAGGLSRYDRNTETFITIPAGPHGLRSAFVRALADDGSGGLWVATDNGLEHLDPDTGAIRLAGGLPDPRMMSLAVDRAGGIWAGTQGGLYYRARGSRRFISVALPGPNHGRPPVRALFADSQGRIWAGTRSSGAYVIAHRGARARAISNKPSLAHETILAIAEARPGEIWIGTYSQGILALDAATLQAQRIAHVPSEPESLANDTIWSLHRDRAGMMWAGSGNGLSRRDPRETAVVTIFGSADGSGLISDSDVISMLAQPDGRVWLGLASNGIDIIDPERGRVGALRPDPRAPDTSLPNDRVFGLARGNRGDVFIGTQTGLFHAGRDGHMIGRVRLAASESSASVDAIARIGAFIWAGSWVDGLWKIDPATSRVLMHVAPARFTDRRINAIIAAPHGDALWIGTSNGLNRFDPRTGAVRRIFPDAADRHALGNGPITSLALDRAGRLWIGTLGAGISILTSDGPGPPRFTRIDTHDGLPNDNADKLELDRAGTMWSSTDRGIAMIDTRTFAVRQLKRADGVDISAYWGGSGTVTPQGEVLFGGGGLTVIRPARLRRWSYEPPLVVTDARVGAVALPASRFNHGDAAPPLIVPADRDSLAIEFAALDYSAPLENRYAYKLDGYDRTFIATDATRRLAAYTNLMPGTYHLEIRGSNRDGTFSARTLDVPITVEAAWYQTVWFELCEALLALAAVAGIVRLRTAYLHRRQRELERSVEERTAELRRTSRALEEKTRALEEASLTDPLTGLRNRRFLEQHLGTDVRLSRRRYEDANASGTVAADADLLFFMVDIDHFKAVNDTYGHAAGDAVLVQLRARLEAVFRDTDYLVRWGGEEFLVVARGSDRRECERLAERLRASVADEPFAIAEGPLPKTCSVGVAAFPIVPGVPAAFRWEDAVRVADAALYVAKNSGRNMWVQYAAAAATFDDPAIALIKSDAAAAHTAGLLVMREGTTAAAG